MPRVLSALLLAALIASAAARLHAQGFATGIRDLGFGSVLPGVPSNVPPTDVARSAQFDITGGQPNAPVEIKFFLPAHLVGPGGATMPVSFGSASAGFSQSGSITSQVLFDPNVPRTFNLSADGRGSGFLGGVLTPAGTQAPGSYSASVSITVAFLGQ